MSKSRIWLIIEIIAGLVLFILVGFFIKRKIDDHFYLKEQNAWKDQIELGIEDKKTDKNWLEERNKKAIAQVEEIRKSHPAVVGIIEIPGTDILYPMVQGKDNDFYLDHNKDGKYHVFGEIFLDARNSSDFADKNTVIYGHNIRQAKTLFHPLIQYGDQKFYEDHKIINIYSLKGFKSYDIIQTFQADPANPYRQIKFDDTPAYMDFLTRYNQASMVNTDFSKVEAKENKRIITLSTCFDKKTRMVIQAIERVEK